VSKADKAAHHVHGTLISFPIIRLTRVVTESKLGIVDAIHDGIHAGSFKQKVEGSEQSSSKSEHGTKEHDMVSMPNTVPKFVRTDVFLTLARIFHFRRS